MTRTINFCLSVAILPLPLPLRSHSIPPPSAHLSPLDMKKIDKSWLPHSSTTDPFPSHNIKSSPPSLPMPSDHTLALLMANAWWPYLLALATYHLRPYQDELPLASAALVTYAVSVL